MNSLTQDMPFAVTTSYVQKDNLQCTVLVLEIESPSISMYVFSQERTPRPFLWLAQGYAIARIVIESILGDFPKYTANICIYQNSKTAMLVIGAEAGYIDLKSKFIHLYPWLSFGHELAHYISFLQYGLEYSCLYLVEGIASFLANPFVSVHSQTQYITSRNGDRHFLINAVEGMDLSSSDKRIIGGSLVGYVIECYGTEVIRALWDNKSDDFIASIVSICNVSPKRLIQGWLDYVFEKENKEFSTPLELAGKQNLFDRYKFVIQEEIRPLCEVR